MNRIRAAIQTMLNVTATNTILGGANRVLAHWPATQPTMTDSLVAYIVHSPIHQDGTTEERPGACTYGVDIFATTERKLWDVKAHVRAKLHQKIVSSTTNTLSAALTILEGPARPAFGSNDRKVHHLSVDYIVSNILGP